MNIVKLGHGYETIISLENLLEAWKEFLRGKKNKKDVQEFQHRLMDNIIGLHNDLKNRTYKHGGYYAFNISDPKPRNIHKATVRDRLLHHAIYRKLYPFFDTKFIGDSYSCRLRKGTHKAMNRFRDFGFKVSKNHTRTAWVLKCDIRKFFASIDQTIFLEIIKKHIFDTDTIQIISEIINSFYSTEKGKGLPLGNLTSQLLVNIYMNEFDQFMKHKLKVKYYIRYADDFVILSSNKDYLLELIISKIADFLEVRLKLSLHPNKVFIKTFVSGVDFLGWVHFPDHRILRTVAKKRMFCTLKQKKGKEDTVQSYLGLMGHGNTKKLQNKVNKRVLNKLVLNNEYSNSDSIY